MTDDLDPLRRIRPDRVQSDDPMLAWLEVGDGVVMIGRAAPEAQGGHDIHTPLEVGQSTCMLNVTVDDVDAHFERARDEGARIAMELNDTFWGDRRYEAYDREGHHWHFHEALSRVRARRGTTDDATD